MSTQATSLDPAAPGVPASAIRAYTRRQILQSFVVAFSLVNLTYMRVWSELLTVLPSDYFFLKEPFKDADYWAAMLGVVILSALLWGLMALARFYLRGICYQGCRVAFLLAVILGPGLGIRSVVMHAATSGRVFGAQHRSLPWMAGLFRFLEHLPRGRGLLTLAVVVALVALSLMIRFLSPLVRGARVVLLCASPFVIVTFSQALYAAVIHTPAVTPEGPTAGYLPPRNGPRAVWIIFDEWDYRLSFPDRDASLRLDAVDRLRNEALFATNALPPAGETFLSIPSYTDGRRIRTSVAESPADLRITYLDNAETVTWGSQPNFFARARAAGVNVGVLGWYLPYCRVLNRTLASCAWYARSIQANTTGDTLVQKLRNQPRSVLETMLLSPFGQSLSLQGHARDYLRMEEALKKLVTDNRLGLVYAHMPAPHSPFIYNRQTDTFSRKNSPLPGYIDELALVNRTLSGLRKTLEDAGKWDDTVFLITSDHPFRDSASFDGKRDPRIPYILKMGHQHQGLSLDTPFNTVTTGELLLAILRGTVSTPEQAANWLRQRA